MLDMICGYRDLLENIEIYIDQSKFKKEYLINELGVSKATFYNKLKKKRFSISEMLKLSTILFAEDAKAFEIKQALERSKKDSLAGRTKSHSTVMANARKRLAK
jgi:predicted XRE-type DNA-binding protein